MSVALSRTINADNIIADKAISELGMINITGSGQNTCTINADIKGGTEILAIAIKNTSTGYVIINGNIYAGTESGSYGIELNNNGGSTYIYGNCIDEGSLFKSTYPINVIDGFLYLMGDITGNQGMSVSGGIISIIGDITTSRYGIYNSNGTARTINITGNVIAGTALDSILMPISSPCNVIVHGNLSITDGSSKKCIAGFNTTNGTINVSGTVSGGNAKNAYAISNQSANCLVYVFGTVIGGTYASLTGNSEAIFNSANKTEIVGSIIHNSCFGVAGEFLFTPINFGYVQISTKKYYASSEVIGGAVWGGLGNWVW